MKRIVLILLLLSCSKVIKDMNLKNKDMNEELALAIIDNAIDKAIALINKGANINYIYRNQTILEISLYKRKLKIIKILLEKGVEVKKENIAKIYDIELEDFNYDIINSIKDKYKIEEGEIDNNKYFLLLCYISNAEELRRFIEKNNINPKEVKDKRNRNGLIISTVGNKIDILKILIEEYRFDIEHKNNNGVTSLIMASTKGYLEIFKFLLERGANIDEKQKKGYTSLIIASHVGHTDIVKLLLEKGASINDKDKNGWTALMTASDNGHTDIVKLLLERGANVNNKNRRSGSTSLMKAAFKGYTDIVKLLLEKGASVDEKEEKGWSAMMFACQKGHIEVVKLLLEKGASVDEKEEKGWTSLMLACQNGHIETAKLLIKRGANIYQKNIYGGTVFICMSKSLKSSKNKFEKIELIQIFYILIRKMAEDYIQLFISLNKDTSSKQKIKDEVHNYINLLYSLERLPEELFEEIMKKF